MQSKRGTSILEQLMEIRDVRTMGLHSGFKHFQDLDAVRSKPVVAGTQTLINIRVFEGASHMHSELCKQQNLKRQSPATWNSKSEQYVN